MSARRRYAPPSDSRPAASHSPSATYQVSGRLGVRMDDGTEFISGPGDVLSIPSGHDGWVVGDEPVVVIDFHGASSYAKGG